MSTGGDGVCFATTGSGAIVESDHRTMMNAVSKDGVALQFASQQLRNDRDIVMRAVSRDGHALRFASQALRNDRDIVLEAVAECGGARQLGCALQFASEELRNDREVVIRAVSTDWRALQFASKELKSDREVVMEAVSEDGLALQFASEELQNDREVVMEAVSGLWGGEPTAYAYASEKLRNDRDIGMEVVSQNWRAIQSASETLREDDIMAEWVFASCGSPPQVIGLRATLLSGRSCRQFFSIEECKSVEYVLREFARLLDLDTDHVARNGQFVLDRMLISSLMGLRPGEVHELTLAIS